MRPLETDFEKLYFGIRLSPRYVGYPSINPSWFEYGGFVLVRNLFLNGATVKTVKTCFFDFRLFSSEIKEETQVRL